MYSELPTELIVKILQFLDLKDLLRCRKVEKRLRDIIDSTPQLQYQVELAVAYCTDNESSDVAVTEKLRMLRQMQASWKRARFGLGASLPYEYEWTYAGNVLHREFEFMSLHVDGTDGLNLSKKSWTLDPGMLDFFWLETAIDPAQDLAVFLGMNKHNLLLHVMVLSSGELLHEEPLQVPHPQMEDVQTTLRIYGHLAALVFVGLRIRTPEEGAPMPPEYSTVVNVFNLYTGAIETNLACDACVENANARDLFAFVSTTSFLLGSYAGGNYSLELHSIDEGLTTRAPDGTWIPVHVATYQFPSIKPGCFTTGWFLDESMNGALGSLEPFHSVPNPPMLVIKRPYMHSDRHLHHDEGITCVFVIPFTVFRDEVGAYKARTKDAEGPAFQPRVIPWDAWGPASTRCVPVAADILMNPKASLTCDGFRLLVHEPEHTTLMDFNPLDIARDLSQHHEKQRSAGHERQEGEHSKDVIVDPYPGRIVLSPTVISRVFFAEDIITNLPYRETQVEWVGERPSRVVDGNPALTVTGEPTGHGGLNITDYRILTINA